MKKLMALLALALAVGCEVAVDEGDSGGGGGSANPTATTDTSKTGGDTNAAAVSADQAEWDAIAWHGKSCKGAVPVMSLSASISGGNTVNFTYDRFPWKSMGLGHFFVWENGRWRGGKFDWIRVGGQPRKSLENVHDGYNNLSAPPVGTPCAFAWTDADGKQRSNLAKCVWK